MLGKKVNMTQIWQEKTVVPVTVIEAVPNIISDIKTKERDGYSALQLSLGRSKREFKEVGGGRWEVGDYKKGNEITVDTFQLGDKVKISGLTKGRGFQGVVKRHGFGGGPKTHGQKNRFRAPGSIGSTAPQRVTPGRRMAGHMGQERVSIKNLVIAGVDVEKHIIMVRGAVPGARGTLLEIRKVINTKS